MQFSILGEDPMQIADPAQEKYVSRLEGMHRLSPE